AQGIPLSLQQEESMNNCFMGIVPRPKGPILTKEFGRVQCPQGILFLSPIELLYTACRSTFIVFLVDKDTQNEDQWKFQFLHSEESLYQVLWPYCSLGISIHGWCVYQNLYRDGYSVRLLDKQKYTTKKTEITTGGNKQLGWWLLSTNSSIQQNLFNFWNQCK